MQWRKEGRLEDIQREASLLKQCQHPCIVKLVGVEETREGRGCLILERYADGDLGQHLPFPKLEQVWDLFIQLLLALLHLHEQQKIVHGDIKPANILLEEKEGAIIRIRLGDFGSAHGVGEVVLSEGGTPYYLAPELWQSADRPSTPASDVWALGCTLYELHTGEKAFPAKNLLQLRQAIMQDWNNDRVRDPELQTLISWMLTKDPLARPSCKDLLHKLRSRCQDLQQRLSAETIPANGEAFDRVWQQLVRQWGEPQAYRMIMTLLKVKFIEVENDNWYGKAKSAWNSHHCIEQLNQTLHQPRLSSFQTQITQSPLKLTLPALIERQQLLDHYLTPEQQTRLKQILNGSASCGQQEKEIIEIIGGHLHQQLQLRQAYAALRDLLHFERQHFPK